MHQSKQKAKSKTAKQPTAHTHTHHTHTTQPVRRRRSSPLYEAAIDWLTDRSSGQQQPELHNGLLQINGCQCFDQINEPTTTAKSHRTMPAHETGTVQKWR